jgi:hypothetical protein
MLDELTFMSGVALTLFAPAILCVVVVGQLWPLFVMGCNEGLGLILGLAMFKKPSEGFLACIPSIYISPVLGGANICRLKKAA